MTVYRVRDVSNPANKFKVDMNAQQYHLTGCMLLYQDVNIVAVEGDVEREERRLSVGFSGNQDIT